VRHLGISLSSSFLGSSTTAGFLYVSDPTSSSCSLVPDASYLFGILIHQSELPTAQCFPMRLLLRLGYEYQSR
jgi:MAD (mothers against decapentaplegic) interacting protein